VKSGIQMKTRIIGLVTMVVFTSLGTYFLVIRPDIWWTIYPLTHRPLPYIGGIFFCWLGIIGLILLVKGIKNE